MNKWKYISVTKPVIFQPTTYWSFNESTVFVTDSATADTVLFGDYFLKNNMMVISGASTTMKGGELFKGNFQVLELKDSTLILVRKEYIPDTINDGLIYHEFVKAN
ncbi:MAG: hypothetical protein ACO3EE_08535 [Flavobacteriales bacterium]